MDKGRQKTAAAKRSGSTAKRSQPTTPPHGPLTAPLPAPPEPGTVRAEDTPPKRIRLITRVFDPKQPQSTMGRRVTPFAKPAQSGSYSPWAIPQARRGR
jgi:hypothetical protein